MKRADCLSRRLVTNRLSCAVAVLASITGCSKDTPTPTTQGRQAGAAVAAPKASSEAPADETSPPAAHRVTLGSPELTSGIPGEGPLTLEQIHEWLAKEENHVPLEVELPLGLSAGQSLIKGLDENPLTRAKIELGRQLYFDPRLSADSSVSCASCHDPDEGYTRDSRFGIGVNQAMGGRNSPVSYNRILSDVQFWDGRAATLEEQAKGPIANSIEMGNTHDACVECVAAIQGYRIQFDRIFGTESVSIDSIAKAIAAFERAIVTGPSPADHYEILRTVRAQYDEDELEELQEESPELYEKYERALAGSQEMSESAIRGREIFFTDRGSCTACHVGANFTDEKYHNLGVGMDADEPDLGRFVVSKEEKDRGAFKTPTVRNVALTAPYMHDGSQQTLEEVVEWYAKGGHPNPHLSDKMKKLDLTDQDKKDLVAYMKALTGDFPKVERARLPE